jgi:hypothetical protein
MLSNLYTFLSRGDLVIHPTKFPALVSALQSARNVPHQNSKFVLDKSTQSLDALDSMQLAMFNFNAEAPTEFEDEEEVEEEKEEENNVLLS